MQLQKAIKKKEIREGNSLCDQKGKLVTARPAREKRGLRKGEGHAK